MSATERKPVSVPRKRRWLQFSLRSMFLLMTVFAVWLGVSVDRARRQRAAVEAIRKVGGSVYYEYQTKPTGDGTLFPDDEGKPPGPAWLRSLLGDDFLSTVVCVRLSFVPNLTNDDVAHLARFPHLRTLFLCGGDRVNGEALAHLRNLRELDDVSLGIQLTDRDLAHLAELKGLRFLFLMGPKTNSYVVRSCSRTERIRDESYYDSQVTKEGVEQLAEALPNCHIGY